MPFRWAPVWHDDTLATLSFLARPNVSSPVSPSPSARLVESFSESDKDVVVFFSLYGPHSALHSFLVLALQRKLNSAYPATMSTQEFGCDACFCDPLQLAAGSADYSSFAIPEDDALTSRFLVPRAR